MQTRCPTNGVIDWSHYPFDRFLRVGFEPPGTALGCFGTSVRSGSAAWEAIQSQPLRRRTRQSTDNPPTALAVQMFHMHRTEHGLHLTPYALRLGEILPPLPSALHRATSGSGSRDSNAPRPQPRPVQGRTTTKLRGVTATRCDTGRGRPGWQQARNPSSTDELPQARQGAFWSHVPATCPNPVRNVVRVRDARRR